MFTPARGLAALIAAGAMFATLPGIASAARHDDAQHAQPTIYGHRGASGYRPEHTVGSYRLAARLGADYIEPDLVMTKDHVLVARHEPAIGGTTDVAQHPEFASRRKTRRVDGISFPNDWFVEDFTLAELKTLRAVERLPDIRQHNTIWNGRYTIPTFQEVIDLRDQISKEVHRQIGIVPELKHSTYHRSIGLPLEEVFVNQLRRNHLDNRDAKVTVQSFEVANLKALNKQIPNPLVQLLDAKTLRPGDVLASGGTLTYGQMATPEGLREIRKYADVASPSKDYIVPRDATGRSLPPTTFIRDAHKAGLDVVAYTFRVENSFLPLELRSNANLADSGNLFAEIKQFFDLGIDGIFTDNSDIAKAVRDDE